ALLLAMIAGRRLRQRLAPWAAAGGFIFLALTYALAVDPKARMFLLPLAMAAAACACSFTDWRRWPAGLLLAAAVASGLWVTAGIPNVYGAEEVAPAF